MKIPQKPPSPNTPSADAATQQWVSTYYQEKRPSTMSLLWDSLDSRVALPASSLITPALDQRYAHLRVIVRSRSDQAGSTGLRLRINGDSGTNYYITSTKMANSALTGLSQTAQTSAFVGDVAGTTLGGSVSMHDFVIADYSRGTLGWPALAGRSFNPADASLANMEDWSFSNLWALSPFSAVSTLTFFLSSGNLASPTRISVYGILG